MSNYKQCSCQTHNSISSVPSAIRISAEGILSSDVERFKSGRELVAQDFVDAADVRSSLRETLKLGAIIFIGRHITCSEPFIFTTSVTFNCF